MIRYVRLPIPAIVAAARTNPTNVVSFDDAKRRKLLGFLMTNQTKLIHVQLDVAGRVFADLDGGVQAQQRDFISLDQDFAEGIIFSVNVINDSAGALAANVDALILKYDAPPTP